MPVFDSWCNEPSMRPTGIDADINEVRDTDAQRAQSLGAPGLTTPPKREAPGEQEQDPEGRREEATCSAGNWLSQGGPRPVISQHRGAAARQGGPQPADGKQSPTSTADTPAPTADGRPPTPA